ncbi:hypothetical protein [Cytobacillus purgationiresistens]|uniref:Uncharacterized protein n=1 Tax=Cytobacillus purgationiresistens TaxID=863449 RepID=A0ABU0AQK3_9BACI|nr:hypothetical protein [Cytobacillus purgationiresistens]MDQ0273488.1 hypothetical protein [Cytobacillus purgationiresistens]
MLTDLLWLAEAKMQYRRQKSLGLAGFVGIISVIFLVWEWNDWFYPIFDKIGFVSFAERVGLVSDLSVVTVLNVVLVIFYLCLLYAAICFIAVLIGSILLIFITSNAGVNMISTLLVPFLLPLYFIQKNKYHRRTVEGVYKKDKEKRKLFSNYKHLDTQNRNLHLYLEQEKELEGTVINELTITQAEYNSNRVMSSIMNSDNWLLAYNRRDKKIYVLLPNPLPSFGSQAWIKHPNPKGVYNFEEYFTYHFLEGTASSEYYLPTLETEVIINDGKLQLKAVGEITSRSLWGFDYFEVKSSGTLEYFDRLLKERKDLYEVLLQAHVAYYLLPIAYRRTNHYAAAACEEFIQECKLVPNGDKYIEVYSEAVRKEIEVFAYRNQEWAINWLEKAE